MVDANPSYRRCMVRAAGPALSGPARCCSTRLGSALRRISALHGSRCTAPLGSELPPNRSARRCPATHCADRPARPDPARPCTARLALHGAARLSVGRPGSARRYLAWPRADCPAPHSTARPALYGSSLLARCRTVRHCKARSLPLDGSAVHGARRSARRCRPGITPGRPRIAWFGAARPGCTARAAQHVARCTARRCNAPAQRGPALNDVARFRFRRAEQRCDGRRQHSYRYCPGSRCAAPLGQALRA